MSEPRVNSDPPQASWWNPFSWKAAQAETDRADAERARLNADRALIYGPGWEAQVAANDSKDRADNGNYSDQVGAEYEPAALLENLKESTASAASVARGVIDAPLKFIFGSIPPLGWLVIAGVVFWWLGGPLWLRGKLNK